MKSVFREFYNNEKVNFNSLDEDILIVFDTNTLLNIYRYSKPTRNTFLTSLEKVKDNIWIPYQVGLEFNLNRREAMLEIETKGVKIADSIKNKVKSFVNDVKKDLDSFPIKSIDGQVTRKEITESFEKEIYSLQENFLNNEFKKLQVLIDNDDDKMNHLADLFEGKVGESFTQEQIHEICEEGKVRYEKNVPPGFKDKTKIGSKIYNALEFESKYGDLILWKQIIQKAKLEKKRIIVFVTDDHKEDWWYEIKGKKIGARAELKNELKRESGSDLILMNTNTFLKETSSDKLREDLVVPDKTNIFEYKYTFKHDDTKFSNYFSEIIKKNFAGVADLESSESSSRMKLEILISKISELKSELDVFEKQVYKTELSTEKFSSVIDNIQKLRHRLLSVEDYFVELTANDDISLDFQGLKEPEEILSTIEKQILFIKQVFKYFLD